MGGLNNGALIVNCVVCIVVNSETAPAETPVTAGSPMLTNDLGNSFVA